MDKLRPNDGAGANDRLLIVDDDLEFITILRHMLNEYSDQHFATSAIEGLRMARELLPDLILVDYEMPDLSGADLCTVLKSDPVLRAVPVIFITGHHKTAVITATFKAGGSDFITKPVSRALLLRRVREQLQPSHERKSPAGA